MYKLVILVEGTGDLTFDDKWPQFLHQIEQIPGLIRESTSRVDRVLYGDIHITMIHELYFASLEALQHGMASPTGQEAGRLLQEMTAGRVTLLFADHKQDELENIRKYKKTQEEDDATADID
jgi:hypothetical protein